MEFNNITEKGEAVLSRLTLKVTEKGQLVLDRETVDLHKVRKVCGTRFTHIYDTAVWVDNLLNVAHQDINTSLENLTREKNESICIQE